MLTRVAAGGHRGAGGDRGDDEATREGVELSDILSRRPVFGDTCFAHIMGIRLPPAPAAGRDEVSHP
ncbi:hypothetical protein [Streptomyces albogriseolus]|uniref:hypothetical protein n=1 Tax=Streptomyces albogriseolus TaxID=1887 RepID=UPI0036FF3CAC